MTCRMGAALVVVGFAGMLSAQTLRFSDRTVESGLFITPSAYNRMSGGGAAGDFNNDGWMDLFVVGGSAGSDRLFINNGDGTFREEAAKWGVDRHHYGYGAAAGDFDGDGWLDLFITSGGLRDDPDAPRAGQHILYRNNGDGSFTNVAEEMGVARTSADAFNGWGAAFGDYDLDGDLDLAVSGWIHDSQPANCVFRNDGPAGFVLVNDEILRDPSGQVFDMNDPPTRGFCPAFCDMNGDRYPELLWVADFLTSKYFVNDGGRTLAEFTAGAGAGLDGNGMGTFVNDIDNDGDMDWYVSSIFGSEGPTIPGDGNKLYLNRGDGTFDEIASSAGVDDGGWGWGTIGQDLDHDGFVDIVETNGWLQDLEYDDEQSYLWLNNGDLTFRERAMETGLVHTGQGRSVIAMDGDRDGDLDIVIISAYADLVYFRNDLKGPDTHWLHITLDRGDARRVAPDGIGAFVRVRTGSLELTRAIVPVPHFLGQSELSAHFGLGEHDTIESLTVNWPDGRMTRVRDLAADQHLEIRYCEADMSGDEAGVGDGMIDGRDFRYFLERFASGDPVCDLTGTSREDEEGFGLPDGDLDADDFFYFLDRYASGC